MASVSWDVRGIIFIDYLQTGKTFNGENVENLLQRLSNEIKKKLTHAPDLVSLNGSVINGLLTMKRWYRSY